MFYLRTQFKNFSSFKVPTKEKAALSKIIEYHNFFYFLQCALSDFFSFAWKFVCNLLTYNVFIIYSAPCQIFFIFASKFVFYRLTLFKIFSSSTGANQRNRCTFKNNIHSHIFILYSAPCQIYLSFNQNLCFACVPSMHVTSTSVGKIDSYVQDFKKSYKVHGDPPIKIFV